MQLTMISSIQGWNFVDYYFEKNLNEVYIYTDG